MSAAERQRGQMAVPSIETGNRCLLLRERTDFSAVETKDKCDPERHKADHKVRA